MLRRGHVRHIDPLLGPATVDEVAADGLAAVEPVARDPAVPHERQRLGGDHLHARGSEGQRDAEHLREETALRPGRHDESLRAEGAARGLDGGNAAAADGEPGHRGVLEDAAAVILERPGVGLYGALGIGVAAEMEERAADGVVARDGHQFLHLLPVEELPPEAPRLADLGPAPREGELVLGKRDADPIRLMLGGIAEELVHLRPEPLLLETEWAVHMRGATAVPPRGLPAHDALLEDEHVHARAGEPPAGAEPGDAAADDDDRGALWICHARLPRDRAGGAIGAAGVLEIALPEPRVGAE